MEHNGDVAQDIMSTFEMTYDVFGSPVNHELVKDGKNIPVTNENRQVCTFFCELKTLFKRFFLGSFIPLCFVLRVSLMCLTL